MPSVTAIEHALDAARKDGENTAMLIAINVVDAFLERSSSLDEFAVRWMAAKGVWETATEDMVSDVARRIGRQAADELRDALAVFQEHRP